MPDPLHFQATILLLHVFATNVAKYTNNAGVATFFRAHLLEVICAEAGISRVYWYDIEAEKVRSALPEETLRKIEKVLGVNLGVNFDD